MKESLSKSCDLKGRQKLFFIQQNTAASCCRSYPQSLDQFSDLTDLLQYWHQESQDLDKGILVQSCQHCWQNEAKGQLSYRQLPHPDGNGIELAVNNACNQMCSYCSPKFSSEWERSIKEQGVFEKISAAAKKNQQPISVAAADFQWLTQISNYINGQAKNSVIVKIHGGEPLMQIRQLQTLLDLNTDHVKQFRITTNLNPPDNKFLVWVLQQIPTNKLVFDISIDASLAFNHVPRAGFDATKFTANLDLVRLSRVPYKFLAVASVLNIFDMENLISWCKSEGHPLEIFPLNNPDCLDARLLPDHFKQQINADNMPNLVKDILKPAATVDFKLFEQYNYLSQYFSRTGIDPNQTSNQDFGQYWQWLENKFK